LLALLCHAAVYAQGITDVYGKVIDAETKEPLEYVNVRLIGALKATLTTPKGEYQIRAVERVDSISFSYLGYKTRTIPIKRGKTQEINIEMGTSDFMLTEVTVKAGKKKKKHDIDTIANYVFHKVVENKERNRAEDLNSYKYEAYEKLQIGLFNPTKKLTNFPLFRPFGFAFANRDTTEEGDIIVPGIIKETRYDVYYRKKPSSYKKVITGEVMTGIDNPSVYGIADRQFQELNLYDNAVIIATKAFVTPFAPSGLSFYYFYLTDTQQINNRTSYKLHFVGKVKEDVALKGYAWIDSATWAISSIYVKPNEKANLNFINSYYVIQDYKMVDDQHWMLQREQMNSVSAVFKNKGKLKFEVTKVLNRRNFDVSTPLPDSIINRPEELILLDSARKRNEVFWDTTRFEQLTPSEKKVFWVSDTIFKVPAWKTYMWLGKFFTSAYAQAGPVDIGRVLNFVSKNNVEGWRLRFGFKTNSRFMNDKPINDFFRRFYFFGYVAYGLKDKDVKYEALTRIGLPRTNDRWQSLEFMFRYDMRVPGQDEANTILTFDNVATLIGGKVLNKIMKVREFRITYEKEWIRNFSTIAMFNEKTYYEVPGVFDFNKLTADSRTHVPNFNITEFALDTRYAYKDLYFASSLFRNFQTTRYPVFTFRYSVGIVDLQGDNFNFHTLNFSYQHKIQTSFGYSKVWLRAGKIIGKAPYTACFITQGNFGILLDKYNYNLLREFEFISDQSASLWWEHHFDGFFLNKIPGVNKLRWREVVWGKALIGSFDKAKHNAVLEVPSELRAPGPVPYVEVGVGIENIFNLFRVDVMWRATYRDRPGSPNWGVKFAFQPNF